ncbi:hypothetical protein M422DRAFT_148816 [Sphaerobolus stellatus SS14]|nr:hypothetical protein M422DRAFT_148816 [Sphaerobolus stellatus SS14]
MESLIREHPNPNRVWAAYSALDTIMGAENIPLGVHQRTLRLAVPPPERVGAVNARLARSRRAQSPIPFRHEGRLRTIINNIRRAGELPDLEDYHFILEEFAATGYSDGARAVFREITRMHLTPTPRTYGLCLKAIAYRLTLPIYEVERADVYAEAQKTCSELLDDMASRKIPITRLNFDFTIRIYKDIGHYAAAEHLFKIGYGIDLAHPDRLALEAEESLVDSAEPNKILPFTTHALNTLIDMLGKAGRIPQLIIAFEVLTNHLPKVQDKMVDNEDEDDDPAFYQFSPAGNKPAPPYPSAKPNTTTFAYLIRSVARANKTMLTKHYVQLACTFSEEESARLRAELISKSANKVEAPRVRLDKVMFLSLLGTGSRRKNRPLLQWGIFRIEDIMRDVKQDISFLSRWRRWRQPKMSTETLDAPPSEPLSISEEALERMTAQASSSLPEANDKQQAQELLEPTIEAQPVVPRNPFKVFDIDLHLRLLNRDYNELVELHARMIATRSRITLRIMERLGRRVWNNQPIYIPSKGTCGLITREEWVKTVRFNPPPGWTRRDTPLRFADKPRRRR